MEVQTEFKGSDWEGTWDTPCRTCVFKEILKETVEDKEVKRLCCTMGGLRGLPTAFHRLPNKCSTWKKGSELMTFIKFQDMKESELRKELEEIRNDRKHLGRSKRKSSMERRVADGSKAKRTAAPKKPKKDKVIITL